VSLQDIFRMEGQRMSGEGRIEGQLVATGIRPHFAENFHKMGVSEVWMGSQDRPALR
jgi:hypothetical protein